MTSWNRTWLVLALLALLAAPGWGAEVGSAAPEFALRTFGGQQLSKAALAGKPLLLVFWNTWCVNCQQELVKLNRLAQTYGPNELEILTINTGINDSEGKAREFLKQRGYTFDASFDHGFTIGDAYQVRGVPTVCLIDGAGVLRYRQAEIPLELIQRLVANPEPKGS
jgi:cytochrome c biogenesis protein CcmG, thiol:disulfide interchange protein DsbE